MKLTVCGNIPARRWHAKLRFAVAQTLPISWEETLKFSEIQYNNLYLYMSKNFQQGLKVGRKETKKERKKSEH